MKLWIPFSLWKGWWNLNWSCPSGRLMLDLQRLFMYTQLVIVYCALKEGLLKSIMLYRRAPNNPIIYKEESMTFRQVLDVLRLVTLLSLTRTSLSHCCSWFFVRIFFFLTQRSDLACSERLVSPSGDVGLNSRVWSDYVSAVWEIPLGPVGSLHFLCWQ